MTSSMRDVILARRHHKAVPSQIGGPSHPIRLKNLHDEQKCNNFLSSIYVG